MNRLFILFFIFIFSCQNKSISRIAIQGFGNVKKEDIGIVKESIEEVYNFDEIIILENIEIPKSSSVNIKKPRYRADSLIKYLKNNISDSIHYVVGITNQDISTTKRNQFGEVKEPRDKYIDWGIFGLGYRPGKSCIVSTFRINRKANKETFVKRLKKITAHEIGHNLGLKHCKESKKCVMRDAAETVKTVDNVDLLLCEKCRSKI